MKGSPDRRKAFKLPGQQHHDQGKGDLALVKEHLSQQNIFLSKVSEILNSSKDIMALVHVISKETYSSRINHI